MAGEADRIGCGGGVQSGGVVNMGEVGAGMVQSGSVEFKGGSIARVKTVRLISIWYCKWFMLFMTLDMPDEGTR